MKVTAVVGVNRERVAPAPAISPPPGVAVDGNAAAPLGQAQAVPAPSGVAVDRATEEADFLWDLRKYVMLLATLAATVTYSAGLSPPGGFWPDNVDGGVLLTGDPVLPITYPRRYKAFFYCNASAFVASLIVLSLLVVRVLCRSRRLLRALQAVMVLDQFCLMGAYAAGSCRDMVMSAYVLLLVAVVALYVLIFALLSPRAQGGQKDTPADGTSMERSRKYLLIFATLAATITYQAGLSTPGGFWQGSQAGDHLAGDILLRAHHPFRFIVFFYSNTTAFVASLVVVMLLMSNTTMTRHGFQSCRALWVCTGAAMVGLIGAFASGSCRDITSYIFVVTLPVAAVLIAVLAFLCKPVKKNYIHDVQVALSGRYLKFDTTRSEQQQIQQHQQSRASQHSNCDDAYQILNKSRTYLLLLGILVVSVTYQAGLNTPGGFWQSGDAEGHYDAGDPILHNTDPRRYEAFFYLNSTAFLASLIILVLILTNEISTKEIQLSYYTMQVAMLGAFAAGSCRQVSKSVYVLLLVVPVLLYIGVHVVVFLACVAWRQAALREKLEQSAPGWLKEVFFQHAQEEAAVERTLEKTRKLLLLLAILSVSLTYPAGMSPPGGFWQESKPGGHHDAGDPVLNDNYRRRYLVFFYCNATAFIASLVAIILLLDRKLTARGRIRPRALSVCVILDLVGLMGAFAAGSCQRVSRSSIYILVLILPALLCIAILVALVLSDMARGLAERFLSKIRAVIEDAGAGGLPSTASDVRQVRDLWDTKHRKYLLLVAALAAAVTYPAAMSPPGGLWSDGLTDRVAGEPVLATIYPRRYNAFFYCNATSFMASLVVTVLLLIERVSNTRPVLLVLHTAMIVGLLGLVGAYAAGCSRLLNTAVYYFALILAILLNIALTIIAAVRQPPAVAGRSEKRHGRAGRASDATTAFASLPSRLPPRLHELTWL